MAKPPTFATAAPSAEKPKNHNAARMNRAMQYSAGTKSRAPQIWGIILAVGVVVALILHFGFGVSF